MSQRNVYCPSKNACTFSGTLETILYVLLIFFNIYDPNLCSICYVRCEVKIILHRDTERASMLVLFSVVELYSLHTPILVKQIGSRKKFRRECIRCILETIFPTLLVHFPTFPFIHFYFSNYSLNSSFLYIALRSHLHIYCARRA